MAGAAHLTGGNTQPPKKVGLYDPAFERDACGRVRCLIIIPDGCGRKSIRLGLQLCYIDTAQILCYKVRQWHAACARQLEQGQITPRRCLSSQSADAWLGSL